MEGLALESALWCRYCYGSTDSGRTIEPNDPSWERLQGHARRAKDDPAAWLAMRDIYGAHRRGAGLRRAVRALAEGALGRRAPRRRSGATSAAGEAVADPPSLVIFDCDGVLVDSEPIALRLLRGTLAAAGVVLTPAEADDLFLGRSLATTREIVARDYGFSVTDAALDDMRRELYAAFRAELRPIAGVAETLDALPCGYCVASSSQPERIRFSLEVAGLWPRFEGRAFSSTMVAHGKPAPDLFLHAARSLGYAPAACLVVEDSPAGIMAAQAADMRVVAFTGGSHAARKEHRDRVAALAPDAVIDDMRELVRLCRGDT